MNWHQNPTLPHRQILSETTQQIPHRCRCWILELSTHKLGSKLCTINNEGRHFLNALDNFYLQQLITVPTRYSKTTSSELDQQHNPRLDLIVDCVVGREFSDHCRFGFCIHNQIASSNSLGRRILLCNKGDYDKLCTDMKQLSFAFFQSSPDSCSVNSNWLSSSKLSKHQWPKMSQPKCFPHPVGNLLSSPSRSVTC